MGREVRGERRSADGDGVEALSVVFCHDVSDGARIKPEDIAAVGQRNVIGMAIAKSDDGE
jgi:hypothetical protein